MKMLRRIGKYAVLAIVGIIVLWMLAFFAVRVARARDIGQYAQSGPDIRNWIRGLKDKNGLGCCDYADGYKTEAEWDTKENHYRVRIEGEWYVVPDSAVLTEPNKLGYAVVWHVPGPDGKPKIRCFIAGGGT